MEPSDAMAEADPERKAKVERLMAVTNSSREECERFLDASDGNENAAAALM